MLLKAVRSQRRFEQVAEQISKLIKKGKLKPGARLPPERELAKQLEVSRPTVREAMIALEISGLVEVRVGSGIYVLETEKKNLKLSNKIKDIGPGPLELIEARKEIEGNNAALAAQRIDAKCLEQLEQAVENMVQDNLVGADGDREFHLLVAKATGNSVLETLTTYLWDQQQNSPMWTKLLELMQEKKLHTTILDDHQSLLDSFRQKNSKEAQAIMRNHLNHARDIYFDLIDENQS
ncbi:MAG TPA: FadR family transcriptional regulator [Candidatus Lambdaproteobacteria bacterium]|nr:GntR family transcriptional regulator [Deltaproteobacteria bacterium]HHZ78532.1 FadR family transcriptional regulator [Candidatus Lambdaproteobacteria bacterium]HIA57609.1 FadR family transcriptional regulator [Candidatus Lambdaproteobacteria bacterium]HIB46255.1 FadR family transcriptional regulator [Candidatus Lambdaproteobacteria bacterium]HIB93972.1 FadR family transcriptional regulator [Candidatus Lambdaproteobacteria bacterium]